MATIEQEIEIIKGNQKAHDERDVERFASVHVTLRDMKDNHLFHIEKDIATLKEDNAIQKADLGIIKNDMGWLKWGILALMGGVGAIFTALVIAGLLH